MFDFEKLDIYKKAKCFNSDIRRLIKSTKLDPTTKDQLRRASFSIVWILRKALDDFQKQIEEISMSFQEVPFLNVLPYSMFWKMKRFSMKISLSRYICKRKWFPKCFMPWLKICHEMVRQSNHYVYKTLTSTLGFFYLIPWNNPRFLHGFYNLT